MATPPPRGRSSRFFEAYAQADEATIRRARGLAVLKSLFLILMGQNGDQGLPGGKSPWGPGVARRLIVPSRRDELRDADLLSAV